MNLSLIQETYFGEAGDEGCLLGALEIEGQKVSGLHNFFFDRIQPFKYHTYSDETRREETLLGDLY